MRQLTDGPGYAEAVRWLKLWPLRELPGRPTDDSWPAGDQRVIHRLSQIALRPQATVKDDAADAALVCACHPRSSAQWRHETSPSLRMDSGSGCRAETGNNVDGPKVSVISPLFENAVDEDASRS